MIKIGVGGAWRGIIWGTGRVTCANGPWKIANYAGKKISASSAKNSTESTKTDCVSTARPFCRAASCASPPKNARPATPEGTSWSTTPAKPAPPSSPAATTAPVPNNVWSAFLGNLSFGAVSATVVPPSSKDVSTAPSSINANNAKNGSFCWSIRPASRAPPSSSAVSTAPPPKFAIPANLPTNSICRLIDACLDLRLKVYWFMC